MFDYDFKIESYSDEYEDEVTNNIRILLYKMENINRIVKNIKIEEYSLKNYLKFLFPIQENKLDILKLDIISNDNTFLNTMLLSNNLSILIIDKHVELVKSSDSNKITYKMDSYAINHLNTKFGLNLKNDTFIYEDDINTNLNDNNEDTMSLN